MSVLCGRAVCASGKSKRETKKNNIVELFEQPENRCTPYSAVCVSEGDVCVERQSGK